MKLLSDGSYSIEDEISIDGEGISPFIFGRGWLLEIIELEAGEFYFFSNGNKVRPRGRRFGVFYPPFSIIVSFVKQMRGHVSGIGAVAPSPGLPDIPVLFETDFDGRFTCAADALEVLQLATDRQSIEFNSRASLLSLKAKRLIDENFEVYPSIARIAGRLDVSHAHLSRQFKRDFEMSPSAYLHQLRVAEATHRLGTGETIIDVSMDVGYNDLSRFYKQFHKVTQTSPAACREMLNAIGDTERISKNAKTTPPPRIKIAL
jgi:AraC-like DNA-binding protein